MIHTPLRLIVAIGIVTAMDLCGARPTSAGQDAAQPPAAPPEVRLKLDTTSPQTQQSPDTKSASPMEVHGSVDVGYRFTDINGSADTFRQLFDLSGGARVMGIELNGVARDSARAFADTFTIRANNLGGDPFPSLQVIVRKSNQYDLRINWRKSRFFDISPALPSSIGGFDTRAVADRHSWSTTRQIGNVAWSVDATERLHFLFNYDRVQREGTVGSTRSIEFVGAPSAWGAFARANPYLVNGRVDDSSDRVSAGVSYGRDHWTIHYKAGYLVSEETLVLDPSASPERSINVGDATTAAELLSTLGSSQSRRQKAPSSELTFVVRPTERFEWRGEHLYFRYRGPFSLDATLQGIARTNSAGTLVSPYQLAVSARGEATAPSQVVGQGMTYRPSRQWAIDLDYRYSRFSSDATGQFASLLALYSGVPANPQIASEQDHLEWRQTTHTVGMSATYRPTSSLTIRPGVRLTYRDVLMRDEGVVNDAASEQQQDVWPELNVGYRPVAWLSVRGNYKTSYSDASYTRMSPSQRSLGHVVVSVDPLPGLTIDVNANVADLDFYTAGFVSHTRAGSVHASYDVNDRLSVLGGLDYQRFLGLGNATFLRGTPPITNVPMRDQETDRVWLAGITFKPASWLEITATGNFDRASGTDAIEGEPPLYGPASFNYGTASVSCDIPRLGRVSIDLQRASFLQDVLPLNDFRTNVLTVRYGRRF